MKKIYLLSFVILLTISITAQVSKTLNVSTAGTLSTLLTATEKETITNLTLTGNIDYRDITCIRTELNAYNLDISAVSIKASASNLANELPENSFNNKTLYSIKLPNSLTSIGESAFKYCLGLNSITIPNSVTIIGRSAFYHCTSLRTISLSSSLTTIKASAFYECANLTSITIPKSVTSIEMHAFTICSGIINVEEDNQNYSSLNGVLFNKNQTKLIKCPISKSGNYIIPNTVDSIEINAFFKCSLLTSVSNISSLTTIGGGAFGSCTSLTSVSIPNSVTTIDVNCFEFCSNLTSITIPNSVTSLASITFYGFSSFTSITIPNLVTSIGSSAFYGCTNLKSIYSYNPIPPTTGSLSNINTTACTLYVPVGTKALYASATGWKDFVNIVEMTTGLPSIRQSNIILRTENKNLIIENAPIGSKIKIFSVSGIKLKDKLIVSDQLIIKLEKGIYLIYIGNYSDKVIIR